MSNEPKDLSALSAELEAAIEARDAARERVPDPDAWARMGDPTRAVIARWAGVEVRENAPWLLELLGHDEVAWARAAAAALRADADAAREVLREWAPEHPDGLLGAAGELWLELEPVAALEEVFAAHGDAPTLEALWRWVPGGVVADDPMLAALIREGEAVGELVADAYMATRGGDLDATVPAAAARAIARTRHGRALEVLRDVWGRFVDEEAAYFVRNEVLWGLYHLGDEGGLDIAAGAMELPGLSNAASHALSRMGEAGEEAAGAMISDWADEPELRYARHDAVRVLARSESERAGEVLGGLVEDHDHATRQLARGALTERGAPEMLEWLLGELDGDETERDDAIELLARHPDPSARAALVRVGEEARAAGDDFLAEDVSALVGRWDAAFG